MTFQIFLPCYYGTQITTMSEKLSTSFFHSSWAHEDIHYRCSAKIFMEFVKRPIKISAIGIFEVNLEAFKTMSNSAYSLYAVFKRAS